MGLPDPAETRKVSGEAPLVPPDPNQTRRVPGDQPPLAPPNPGDTRKVSSDEAPLAPPDPDDTRPRSGEHAPPGADPGFDPDLAHQPPPPTEAIGPYRLVELLGRGAMGEVWLAEHEQLGACALKLVSPELAADEESLRRFQREIEVMARVDRHPSIVRIHSAGKGPGGRPYYAMEYVEGRTLKVALRDGLPREAALDALEQIADGLAHAHARGLIHRDVKPDNILLPWEGVARLADFGLARGESRGNRLTRTGDVVGTPAYMSPEQAKPDGKVGPWTDVWALGAILYELLAGKPPYVGSVVEIYACLYEGAPIAPPTGSHPEVSPALEAVALHALKHDGARRPRDAAAFLEELRAARRGEAPAAGATPPGGGRRAAIAALVALNALLLAGAALAIRGRHEPGGVAGATSSLVPRPPGEEPRPELRPPLEQARELAALGRSSQAVAVLGTAGPSFVRAERALLLGSSGDARHALRLLACAERGGDLAAAARADRLLEACAAESPAVHEARARAALLLGDAAAATSAAQATLARAPEDPQPLLTAARAEGLALARRGLELDLARLAGQLDPRGEVALADAWEGLARRLAAVRQLEGDGPARDAARLWAVEAWTEALVRRTRAGEPAVAPREAAGQELAPLLEGLPREGLRQARQQLLAAGRSGDGRGLQAAELALADAARQVRARGPAAVQAVFMAARLGESEGRLWAEAWLGLAGDLPARAALALARSAQGRNPGERVAWLEHARRLAPDLPLVLLELEALRLDPEASPLGAPRGREALTRLGRLLAQAPELWAAATLSLRQAPLDEAELARVLREPREASCEALLGRALARLHATGVPSLAQAAADAEAALALDPGCAAAHLLLAQALGRGEDAARALECAAAAAPCAAEPILRLLPVERAPGLEELEPLLLQGHSPLGVARLLGRELGELPALDALYRRVVSDRDGRPLVTDPTDATHRRLLLAHLASEGALPRLCLTLSAGGATENDPERAARQLELALARLGRPGPLEHGAEAAAFAAREGKEWAPLRGRAARAALAALHETGPWASGELPPQAALVRAAGLPRATSAARAALDRAALRLLPDVHAVAWTWGAGMRRPDLLRLHLLVALGTWTGAPQAPLLSADDLLEPWSRSRLLLEAAQVAEVQREAGRRWLADSSDEAHLAMVRAAAFERSVRTDGQPPPDGADPLSELADRCEDLVEDALWEETLAPGPFGLLEGLVAESLARVEGLACEAAVLGVRTDLFLARAAHTPEDSRERGALLEHARVAGEKAVPAQIERLPGAEPSWWSHWRLVRLRGALDDRPAFAAELERTREAWRRSPARAGSWRVRAVEQDPLLPLLSRLPGYTELLEQLHPRRHR